MKTLIIIRTYPVDDYISYLCYLSWKKVLPDAKFIFFAQNENDPPPGKYKWIVETGEDILIRGYCCNFGGRSHVEAYIEGLKRIDVSGYDKIICSDADITVHKNPLEHDFEFGGVRHVGNERVYSGQCLIFSRWVFQKLIQYPHYESLFNEFINDGYRSISDDTIFSWLATSWTDKTFGFWDKDYWSHDKFYYLKK